MHRKFVDASAITLSSLCILHCLLLPLSVAWLPFLAVIAEMEWLHKTFVVLALPLTGYAITQSWHQTRQHGFIIPAVIGLALLFGGAFIQELHDYEVLLTLVGAGFLASAHIWRWISHKQP